MVVRHNEFTGLTPVMQREAPFPPGCLSFYGKLKKSAALYSRRKTVANPGVSPDFVLPFPKWLYFAGLCLQRRWRKNMTGKELQKRGYFSRL
jgi:hypothetical protein